MQIDKELENLYNLLRKLRKEDKILLAYIYGSFATGKKHAHSDIDLAIYFNVPEEQIIEVIDEILMSTERHVEILRLDDEEESPFIVQKALKGIPLVEPHKETLYSVASRVLHDSESIRFRRGYKE
ncbi:nucleotidyltransferase domain-containing protein [Thermodesulfovibrio sp. 3907-1M]|uniref:Nucleotidyltransferase domain-containing protein n=1 Tax=Thermodesulfovibrio autotrophicus TaxID=3118333 RepID=A0AAU8GU18_9BACT